MSKTYREWTLEQGALRYRKAKEGESCPILQQKWVAGAGLHVVKYIWLDVPMEGEEGNWDIEEAERIALLEEEKQVSEWERLKALGVAFHAPP